MATVDDRVLEKIYRATTNWMRMIPEFMIIGTQKGGTTSLYNYLIKHPGIGSTFEKEPHFFDIAYHKGLPWYRSYFPARTIQYYRERVQKQRFITGDASPYYLFHPLAAQRISATLPQAKLIMLLRNPVDRAYSQYQHQLRQPGIEPLSFEEAIDCEAERLEGEEEKILHDDKYASFKHRHYSYISRSAYINQLPRWFKIFPREQFLILRSEDLFTDPKAIVMQTLDFLHMPYSAALDKKGYKPFNDAQYEPMKPETRARLTQFFKPLNARLYDLLDRDFGWDS